MVNSTSSNHGGGKKPPKGGVGGATRSWGTTVSGQSISSGSVGSPSSRSEAAIAATPASESARLNNLDIQGDDTETQGNVG